ncbi:hypothetical protein F5Y16DRAFT_394519 [Xylariaceae sp. FL0255]|nr:hypothetical protein F5Y16DRAFT_394519 [Xylariaceae sp. FL0255]
MSPSGDQQTYPQWFGHPPCISSSCIGCKKHNPTQGILYCNARLPPVTNKSLNNGNATSDPTNVSGREHEAPPPYASLESSLPKAPLPFFKSNLPFDLGSVETLAPIHSNTPYHLTFYHLNCARLKIPADVKLKFLDDISGSGVAVFDETGTRYAWSSEIYFDDGELLQKEEISYALDETSNPDIIMLSPCPHTFHAMHQPKFWRNVENGFLEAQMTIKRSWLGGKPEWTYDMLHFDTRCGRTVATVICGRCFCDTQITVELVGQRIQVRATAFRHLGTGTDRFLGKWRYALMSHKRFASSSRREGVDPGNVLARVWDVADRLERPNLQFICLTASGHAYKSNGIVPPFRQRSLRRLSEKYAAGKSNEQGQLDQV